MNTNLKVISGYGSGITGKTAVTGSDIANDTYKENFVNLKIYQWPVIFEGTMEVAFWVSEAYDSTDDEDEVIARVCNKATMLAKVYNKALQTEA